MSHIVRGLAVGVLLVVMRAALAQNAAPAPAPVPLPTPDTFDPPALACLTRPTEPLVYPEGELKRRIGGFIRLRLTFVKPDSAPKVEVLRNTYEPFGDLVTRYARAYRLPCLDAAGPPVVVEQAFSFDEVGAGKAAAVSSSTPESKRALELMACLQSTKKQIQAPQGLDRGEVTNAIYRLVFAAADQAPEVKLLYATVPQGYLDIEARQQLSAYRIPCLTEKDRAFSAEQSFKLSSPQDVWVFKENRKGLIPFLRLMRNIRAEKVDFNFDEMACPFTLRWSLGRPAVDNDVQQLGEPDARREPLIDWLKTLTMDLQPQQFEGLLDQRIDIDVPCLRLKLAGQG